MRKIKKSRKQSVLESTKRHELLQKVCMYIGTLLLIIIVGFSTVNIYAYVKENKERNLEIDYEALIYNQSIYNSQKESFDSALTSFEEQYQAFLYSVYAVETASTVYYNDNAVQEMYQNIGVLKEDALKINESAQLLKNSFVTIDGEENKEFPHLTNTLHIENTKELDKLTVKMKDLTQTVDNSIVNVDFFNGFIALSENRKDVVLIAESMLGKICYEWGGKPNMPGWNERWNRSGNGLDCSGFVQWVYWTQTGIYNENILSTKAISETQTQITFEELKPGDVGLLFEGGSCYLDAKGNRFYDKTDAIKSNKENGFKPTMIRHETNHVGIYAGKDINGDAIWIHCSGDANTVVKDTFQRFSYFYRIN